MIPEIKEKKPKYQLNREGAFVIENYNFAKPFANFFPGVAGKYGIPMWVFYVNRAQGISSFGTRDKDHSILEFFPANKAWQLASSHGFRTFIKVSSHKNTLFYEPFQNGFTNLGFEIKNRMSITSYNLKLEEDNLSLGLKVKVEYFTIPEDSYAGLVRIVSIKNISKSAKKIQVLDGLPQIIPFGTSNLFLKKLGRTIEAWMNVENMDNGVPFYKLAVDPSDKPEVVHIKEGNFYLGFHYQKETPELIKPIVDPQYIFGPVTDFSCPYQFIAKQNFPLPKEEVNQSKTPSAFLLLDIKLNAGCEKTFYALAGHMRNEDLLNESIARITKLAYLNQKMQENRILIEQLQKDIFTKSSSHKFDLYARQTYLDNVLRGGYPVVFKHKEKSSVFYIYSRKHGDLERDYNKFQIQPTYFSQGNGNYRDINQNRRCNLWFNPEVKDEDIITFFDLLQTDGFNPLVVKGVTFTVKEPDTLRAILEDFLNEKDIERLISFLNRPFSPGEVILFLQENKIKLKKSYDEFLAVLLVHCHKIEEAEHSDGFWTDHWTYNLDLLESYLRLYPEKLKELIFEKKVFTYFDNAQTVRPRSEKYLLYQGLPRQLHSLTLDTAKKEIIRKRPMPAHLVRTNYGLGDIFQTTLFNKLLCLLANKISSLDPFGMGIEMEANKPNWFDALNGLPALFGSSICETFELKRLIMLIDKFLEKAPLEKIYVTEEIYDFLFSLNRLTKEYLQSNFKDRDFQYWDKSLSLKESYRQETRLGLSGREVEAAVSWLNPFLKNALKKIDLGLDKARDEKLNLYSAYFINEVAEYTLEKPPFITPTRFIQKKLPLFLESQMHALRLTSNIDEARKLYRAVKKSDLYDKKLKAYKVTASLSRMPEEIGRCRIFSPGWLENESIWLHMEYKYLLELLNQGLNEEFYAEFKSVLIPFQNPAQYGRSILENSSFLVSSAFVDKSLHGTGFVARLSGSTAEFLQIWLVMNLGIQPFFLNEQNELNLKFSPLLAGWLFSKKSKTYSFNFLGKTLVIYHNPKMKDTFGRNATKAEKIIFNDKDGNPAEIHSDTIPSPYAQQIRSRQIKRIDIYFSSHR